MSWYPCTRLVTLCLCVWLVVGQMEERKPPNIKAPTALESATIKYIPSTEAWGITCQAEAGDNVPSYKWVKLDGDVMINVAVSEGNYFTVDSTTGKLDLVYPGGEYVTYKHDGTYLCVAEVTFKDNNKAASFSPPITIKKLDLNIPNAGLTAEQHRVNEFDYKYFECNLPDGSKLDSDDITFTWYTQENVQIAADGDKGTIYIDTEGGLHFTYVKPDDATSGDEQYKCGIGSNRLNTIKLASPKDLTVLPTEATGVKPVLQYNSNKKFRIYQPASLECVFSGYDPAKSDELPKVEWRDKEHKVISPNPAKYLISDDMRKLTIKEIQEEDEGDYYCIGSNGVGKSDEEKVPLDIISAPIFQNQGPTDETYTEGEDAVFYCDARSLKGELEPEKPVWYINGVKRGNWLNAGKYIFTDSDRKLTIKSVDKANDVGCFQCMVKNDYGETWGDACLTVVLPIDIRTFPDPYQEVKKGEKDVDFTYMYTADEQSGVVTETWYFKNQTYVLPRLPPHFEQFKEGADLDVTRINTTKLTDEEYEAIGGVYTLRISNKDTSRTIQVEVVTSKDPLPPVPVVQSAGFPMWIIGVILAILVLILVIVIIVCCVCKRQQEGDYNVDKKEVGAGLDPKKELMEKGFDDYSRPNYDDYEDVPRQGQPYVPYDDVDAPLTMGDNKSLGEYSEEDEARLGFNEDGSFIGQYYKKDPQGPAPPNYENHASIA